MIPVKLRNEMSEDDYYQVCCITGKINVKIDWHHTWTYGKGNIQEAWAIMPVWYKKHNWFGDKDSVHNCKETMEYVQYLSLQRVELKYLERNFPKKNWRQLKKYLTNKYGEKSENKGGIFNNC